VVGQRVGAWSIVAQAEPVGEDVAAAIHDLHHVAPAMDVHAHE
jgi:hypothetical protein